MEYWAMLPCSSCAKQDLRIFCKPVKVTATRLLDQGQLRSLSGRAAGREHGDTETTSTEIYGDSETPSTEIRRLGDTEIRQHCEYEDEAGPAGPGPDGRQLLGRGEAAGRAPAQPHRHHRQPRWVPGQCQCSVDITTSVSGPAPGVEADLATLPGGGCGDQYHGNRR